MIPVIAHPTDLVDRLAAHRSLRGAPRPELEWIAANGEYRRYDGGETLLRAGEESTEMVVQLTGRILVTFGQTGQRHSMDSREGSVTGLLPYSRLKSPPADVRVTEPTELIAIHRDRFPEMIHECPVITETLVHAMLDRARRFTALSLQDEKVMSLGRLAAGFAHELNNPAAAAASGAKVLSDTLAELGQAAHAVGVAELSESQRASVVRLVQTCTSARFVSTDSPLDKADLEDRFASWLAARGADTRLAATLAEGGVTLTDLEELEAGLSEMALEPAVRWIAAAAAAHAVALDVEKATHRMEALVSAMRRFTYMDRPAVSESTNIALGLQDTTAVLAGRASEKSVAVSLEIATDLPMVWALGPDLNLAWSSLLENAIDAVSEGGSVRISARREGPDIVVRFVDDGPGIPPDAQERLFEPFFTTKAVGQGTGLGLDLVRRVMRAHGGEVEFETQPGQTEFRVRLPLTSRAPA